ncbi:hypothetical protein J4Q44_G00042970 [Coregonus suidteri]|uniref:Uncharacterized protein n=1 Tax=Coregonus suidteri TaxID=861788 RepID=A0AAN8MJ22_9TELE
MRFYCLKRAGFSAWTKTIFPDGQVFTWGQNTSGQLGLGWDEPSAMSPKPLKSLSGIPLVQNHCGGRPQLRSVPFWSCVRLGQEHRRANWD